MFRLTSKGGNIHCSTLSLCYNHPSLRREKKTNNTAKPFWCATITIPIIFQSTLNLKPSRNLRTLSPWKSQLHWISTGSHCVIYHTEKHCSAAPSIQPEIHCVGRKGNLHGEKQRQTRNLLKIVDSRGSKDMDVLSQGRRKSCLWWVKEGRNKHAVEMVLPNVFKVRFQRK